MKTSIFYVVVIVLILLASLAVIVESRNSGAIVVEAEQAEEEVRTEQAEEAEQEAEGLGSEVYTLENQASNDKYEYKLVYKPCLGSEYESLYFNTKNKYVTKYDGSRYIGTGDKDFELYIHNGTLWLELGDKRVVTTEFSITNDW